MLCTCASLSVRRGHGLQLSVQYLVPNCGLFFKTIERVLSDINCYKFREDLKLQGALPRYDYVH